MIQMIVGSCAVLAVLAGGSALAAEQAYPTRPVRLIDPYQPGGGSGLIARLVGAKLSEMWGKQVVVDNRPGAAAAIGTEICARSTPDGYTLCMGTSGSIAISPNVNKVPYDPVKDLIAITQSSAQVMVVALHQSVPINSVKDLIAAARANPGKLIYASSGTGGSGHLAVELFQSMTKVSMTHVPYKGNGPALLAQVSGEVQLGFYNILAVLPHVNSGKLKAIAVTSARRAPNMPTVPTIAESGYEGFDISEWYGIVTTAGTPPAIVERLAREINIIMASPEAQAWIANNAIIRDITTPAEYAGFIRAEVDKLAKIAKDANIKVE